MKNPPATADDALRALLNDLEPLLARDSWGGVGSARCIVRGMIIEHLTPFLSKSCLPAEAAVDSVRFQVGDRVAAVRADEYEYGCWLTRVHVGPGETRSLAAGEVGVITFVERAPWSESQSVLVMWDLGGVGIYHQSFLVKVPPTQPINSP